MQVSHVIFRSIAADDDVVHVDETGEWEIAHEYIGLKTPSCVIFSPNGIRKNLKRPTVVMMAVFSCEDSSTQTCWNAWRKSILLKVSQLESCSLKLVSAGRGYRSNFVIAFRLRKSPHMRHEPSVFFTACIGDAQSDSHHSMKKLGLHLCLFITVQLAAWREYRWPFGGDVQRCGHRNHTAQIRIDHFRELGPQVFMAVIVNDSHRGDRCDGRVGPEFLTSSSVDQTPSLRVDDVAFPFPDLEKIHS